MTGASFNDAFPTDSQKGAIYVASLAVGAGVDPSPMKSAPSIFAHELAHALFIPHAYNRSTNIVPGSPSSKTHVAEDTCLMNYDLDSEHFCGLCMIRMRGWDWGSFIDAEYKIELRLGNPDDLFPTVPLHKEFAERLQVVGLFNRRIDYHDHMACLAFWIAHAKNLFPQLKGGAIEHTRDALNLIIKDYLVEGGALPAPGGFGRFVCPVASPPCMRPLRSRPASMSPAATSAAQPYERYMLEGSNRCEIEQDYFDANPALGKIPIEVTVGFRPRGSAISWALAPFTEGAKVFFKLIAPDPCPPTTRILSRLMPSAAVPAITNRYRLSRSKVVLRSIYFRVSPDTSPTTPAGRNM